MKTLKAKIVNFLMEQVANVFVSVIENKPLPTRVICIIMSISGFFIRYCITKDILYCGILNAIITLLIHFIIVFLLTKYVVNDDKRMGKVVKLLGTYLKKKD